ncbi:hypothetical protein ACFQY0_18910 [Haloferula chungangensis]|uniref:Uncharacterized protein n=1 Tax=Haloferula chungangensis TaxID=1048331 RepID=A0ABW2L9Z8_9BACT
MTDGAPDSPQALLQRPPMDVIRFQCPACSVVLTLRAKAAGFRGACPKCSVEIIGPNPALGLSARLAEVAEVAEVSPPPPELPPEPISLTVPFAETLPPTSEFPPVSLPDLPSTSEWKRIAPGPVISDLEKIERVKPQTENSLRASKPSPNWKAGVLGFAFLLCVILALVAGFSVGRHTAEKESPITSAKPESPPTEASVPAPPPARSEKPVSPIVQSATPRSTGPEATLVAFLHSNDWAERSAYVPFPKRARNRMEAHHTTIYDRPIPVTDISLFEITEEAHIFIVTTPEFPEGFPVGVSRSGNRWLVDWDTFVEFHDDQFRRFAAGMRGEHGIFHLLVQPAGGREENVLFERYRLSPPMPGRESPAFLRRGTVSHARLQRVLEKLTEHSVERVDELLDGKGHTMVLALSYKMNSEGHSFLQIEDVIAETWSHGSP